MLSVFIYRFLGRWGSVWQILSFFCIQPLGSPLFSACQLKSMLCIFLSATESLLKPQTQVNWGVNWVNVSSPSQQKPLEDRSPVINVPDSLSLNRQFWEETMILGHTGWIEFLKFAWEKPVADIFSPYLVSLWFLLSLFLLIPNTHTICTLDLFSCCVFEIA